VIEERRLQVSRSTAPTKKSQLGQFLTPASTAVFMANLFPNGDGACTLLDAGAGIGSLSAAFLERWRNGGFDFQRVDVDAYEIDAALHSDLQQTLTAARRLDREFGSCVRGEDFIHAAVEAVSGDLFSRPIVQYTHAILNPPYKKISSASAHRAALRRVGIETVNLYSAFVALAVAQAALGGQIVAIIPRSFCNGPYYRPFRDFILKRAALRHMHLFESRKNAFKDDDVLQENVILRLECGATQGAVTVTTSTDDTFDDLSSNEHPFDRIVFPGDSERFIHVPTSTARSEIELTPNVRYSLADIGIKVSTGPVVDFRLKAHLSQMPDEHSVPLIYPCHIQVSGTQWPLSETKKPNAIQRNNETEKWLYPTGFYCAVRRFSSKEEKRRVMAGVVDPIAFGDYSVLGFENHLNVFHENKHGLPEALARGLTVFLNMTAVDESFRRFNGHTQVNATDLRLMKYPSRNALIGLGEWAKQQVVLSQEAIDDRLKTLAP
jgi:adenine-specific DNA-methyltransferase